MRWFRTELHVHTVLSPCGDLYMSPSRIIEQAKKLGIDIIAITDHNSTKNCDAAMKIGKEAGITVLPGVEFNTQEEVHCLGIFENLEQTIEIQAFINEHLMPVLNKAEKFGEQLIVDENENILEEEPYLLINALSADIGKVEKKTHELGGLFIPAHIDRKYNSIFSQLGFIPPDLNIDALEISSKVSKLEFLERQKRLNAPIIRNSDAHYENQLGNANTYFKMEKADFKNIKKVLKNKKREAIRIFDL